MIYDYAPQIEPERDHLVYLDGTQTPEPIGRVFKHVYDQYIECMRMGMQSPNHSVNLVFVDDGQHVVYRQPDIVGTCERHCNWLTASFYLLLSNTSLSALLRKWIDAKLSRTRFTEIILEEARRFGQTG